MIDDLLTGIIFNWFSSKLSLCGFKYRRYSITNQSDINLLLISYALLNVNFSRKLNPNNFSTATKTVEFLVFYLLLQKDN
jgi:hypothetical protein